MSFSQTFIDLVNEIEDNGTESSPRDMKVKEAMMASFDIDPTHPIADFKDRPFNFKYFTGELAWYLHRDNDVDYISNFSKFWKNLTNEGTNEINSNYGSLVLNDKQVGWVVDSLVNDKNSRQAIMFFNQPKFQVEGNKDFVCTLYANFFIRNNTLYMKVQMRSNDIFFGLTFDAPFFSFLHQSIFLILKDKYKDLELGHYFHNSDNLHFYERHFNLASEIKENGIGSEYSLILKNKLLDYNSDNGVYLTDQGLEFLQRVDNSIKMKDANYKNILNDYFEI